MSQSGEKTEAATPKKKKDAREKGQVRKSVELNTAFMVVGSFGLLMIMGGYISDGITGLFNSLFSDNGVYSLKSGLDGSEAVYALRSAIWELMSILTPVLLFAFIGGLVINYLQVGFLFTTKPLSPKFDRISPLQGFKRIFTVRTLADLLKSILKISVLAIIVYYEMEPKMQSLAMLMGLGIGQSALMITDMVMSVAFKVGIALGGIALLDYLYQWWQYEKDLKMTKQEIKDENKLVEGDPQTKSRIRQKQRQMGMMRMMQSVPEADVVITNPTHYAVALRYNEGHESAPVVLAKGVDYVAMQIKRAAAEHGIEIVEDKPLAQALYAYCEVGDMIPADMYKAVAEVLAYVYKLKRGNSRAGGMR